MLHTFTSRLRFSSLSLAIACALPLVAHADTTPASSDTNKDKTVTSKKVADDTLTVAATGNPRDSFEAPMMVTVIDGTSPESLTSSSSADMLRRVPGVSIGGTGRTNGQDVSMRGYDRRGVLTLVDGIRQGTDTGHINSTFIDPALIKRIEVVRGPSALLYGSGALGGVISYETVDAADLLLPGQNMGYRVFGTGGTGDHSLGMGPAPMAKPIISMDCCPSVRVTSATSNRATASMRLMMKPSVTCWQKVRGNLIPRSPSAPIYVITTTALKSQRTHKRRIFPAVMCGPIAPPFSVTLR